MGREAATMAFDHAPHGHCASAGVINVERRFAIRSLDIDADWAVFIGYA
jgi:hypothetical protein